MRVAPALPKWASMKIAFPFPNIHIMIAYRVVSPIPGSDIIMPIYRITVA
jgi:hypothetical protein